MQKRPVFVSPSGVLYRMTLSPTKVSLGIAVKLDLTVLSFMT